MTKMTYAMAIDNAINGKIDEETIERLRALKAQLAKRNAGSGERKPTKTQKENEGKKAIILDMLAGEPDGMTATEIGSALGVTCQRASAILNQMVNAGDLNKVKNGKAMRFVLA